LTSAAALASILLKNDLVALITCSAVLTIFIVTGVFGRVELLLLGARLRRVGRVLAISSRETRGRRAIVRLQGSPQWERLWEAFVESADKLGLREIQLDVNVPVETEGYHALWERPGDTNQNCHWRLDLPLVVADRVVGRLIIIGERNGESACQDVQQLLDLVEPFESELMELSARELPTPPGENGTFGPPEAEKAAAAAEPEKDAK
jgi:hypothetical protein